VGGLKEGSIPGRKGQLLSHLNIEHGSDLTTTAMEQNPSYEGDEGVPKFYGKGKFMFTKVSR
jgi:hypothetical protein